MERDGSIIASAALFPYFEEKCAEVAAIAVSPECRGHGQGDKLLGMICHFVGCWVVAFAFVVAALLNDNELSLPVVLHQLI